MCRWLRQASAVGFAAAVAAVLGVTVAVAVGCHSGRWVQSHLDPGWSERAAEPHPLARISEIANGEVG